jgi:hypothetical protein
MLISKRGLGSVESRCGGAWLMGTLEIQLSLELGSIGMIIGESAI